MLKKVTDSIIYVGANDHEVDLFEGQYTVPNGMCYNSYVILDEKIAVMDTIDQRRPANGSRTLKTPWAAASPTTWWCSIWSPTMPPPSRPL